jgi:preprotein translocase subunit SecY
VSSFEKFMAKFKAIFELPELRKKIIFTLVMFMIARVGTHIPAPGVDIDRLTSMASENDILGFINMFSGGAFTRVSIFALGVMPYINASIIMQLLGVIIPKLEEIQKEGESGRKKVTQWTRYVTIAVACVQGFGVSMWLQSMGLVSNPGTLFVLTTVIILTAGTVFLMWLGEQISVYGIGNGVSQLIFLNIISRLPSTVIGAVQKMNGNKFLVPVLVIMALLAFIIVAVIVLFQLGQRKIPVQYVGRGNIGKSMVAQNTYLPVKVNVAGIMPVIFSSVLMALPAMLIRALPSEMPGVVVLNRLFDSKHPVYMIVYASLIIFFAFFYTAMMFDPEKIADNLKQSGGTVPGIRPGQETVEYLEKVVTRITWISAFFLAFIAILPSLVGNLTNLPASLGGTGLIIVVGVVLDTIQQINAQMVMKNYEGFIR